MAPSRQVLRPPPEPRQASPVSSNPEDNAFRHALNCLLIEPGCLPCRTPPAPRRHSGELLVADRPQRLHSVCMPPHLGQLDPSASKPNPSEIKPPPRSMTSYISIWLLMEPQNGSPLPPLNSDPPDLEVYLRVRGCFSDFSCPRDQNDASRATHGPGRYLCLLEMVAIRARISYVALGCREEVSPAPLTLLLLNLHWEPAPSTVPSLTLAPGTKGGPTGIKFCLTKACQCGNMLH